MLHTQHELQLLIHYLIVVLEWSSGQYTLCNALISDEDLRVSLGRASFTEKGSLTLELETHVPVHSSDHPKQSIQWVRRIVNCKEIKEKIY